MQVLREQSSETGILFIPDGLLLEVGLPKSVEFQVGLT